MWIRILAVIGLLATALVPPGAAATLVYPHALFMDDARTSCLFYVQNTGIDPTEVTIDIVFGYPTADSSGSARLQFHRFGFPLGNRYRPMQGDNTFWCFHEKVPSIVLIRHVEREMPALKHGTREYASIADRRPASNDVGVDSIPFSRQTPQCDAGGPLKRFLAIHHHAVDLLMQFRWRVDGWALSRHFHDDTVDLPQRIHAVEPVHLCLRKSPNSRIVRSAPTDTSGPILFVESYGATWRLESAGP